MTASTYMIVAASLERYVTTAHWTQGSFSLRQRFLFSSSTSKVPSLLSFLFEILRRGLRVHLCHRDEGLRLLRDHTLTLSQLLRYPTQSPTTITNSPALACLALRPWIFTPCRAILGVPNDLSWVQRGVAHFSCPHTPPRPLLSQAPPVPEAVMLINEETEDFRPDAAYRGIPHPFSLA